MEEKDTPSWLKKGEGFADITLSRKATLNGVSTDAVRMREPTVADTEISSEMTGSDARREIALIAMLCDVAPDDIRKLPMKDYNRLQKAYLGFTD